MGVGLGVTAFVDDKIRFFSTKLLSIFLIVKGRNDDSYPIRSEMVRLFTHKRIFNLHV